MCDCTSELWAPIPNYVGYYEASTCGRARSVDRLVPHGRGDGYRKIQGQILSLIIDQDGYQYVNLYKNGPRHYKVHHLVLETFVGLRPPDTEGCHWDRAPTNNYVSNLRWGTKSENSLDAVRHGTHYHTCKTHCPLRHQLVEPNLVASKMVDQWRECLACDRARSSQRYARETGQPFNFRVDADVRYAQIMSGTAAISASDRIHCPLDHLLTAPNLTAASVRRGHRQCLACNRAHANHQHARKHSRLFDFRTTADTHYAKIMAESL